MGKISIVADDREPRDVCRHLRGMDGAEVSRKRLKLGDYLCDRQVLAERKAFPDFVASIKDGRLFRQACRLVSAKTRPVLILEGRPENSRRLGLRRDSIQGAIISLTVLLGLPLLRSLNAAETARLLVYTARQVRRQPHGAVYRQGYRPKGPRKRKLFVLQGLPGVGPGRAARLLDHFGSLEAVFFAEPDEIAAVKGIGYPTAKRIRTLVRENPLAGYPEE